MSDKQSTPDQLRAKHAWEEVDKLFEMVVKDGKVVMKDGKPERKPKSHAKAFGGAAKKLPVRIMASGLGQALAFLKAKGKTEELISALNSWVLPKESVVKDLLEAIIQGSAIDLRMYTNETLAYLYWLNRFCEAYNLTDDTTQEN